MHVNLASKIYNSQARHVHVTPEKVVIVCLRSPTAGAAILVKFKATNKLTLSLFYVVCERIRYQCITFAKNDVTITTCFALF